MAGTLKPALPEAPVFWALQPPTCATIPIQPLQLNPRLWLWPAVGCSLNLAPPSCSLLSLQAYRELDDVFEQILEMYSNKAQAQASRQSRSSSARENMW